MLCITGQIPSAQIGRGLGLLHEIPDQLGVLQRLTKWAACVTDPADLPATVAEAFFEDAMEPVVEPADSAETTTFDPSTFVSSSSSKTFDSVSASSTALRLFT